MLQKFQILLFVHFILKPFHFLTNSADCLHLAAIPPTYDHHTQIIYYKKFWHFDISQFFLILLYPGGSTFPLCKGDVTISMIFELGEVCCLCSNSL